VTSNSNLFPIALIPILKMVKEDWTKLKTKNERAIMIRRARTARLIMMWGYFVMFISLIALVSFGMSLRYMTNVTDSDRSMFLPTYYMYNINNSPFYEITFVLQGFSLMAGAIVYTGTDTFMGFFIFHVCGQLENLRVRILDLEFNHFELSFNVQEHIRLIRFRIAEKSKNESLY